VLIVIDEIGVRLEHYGFQVLDVSRSDQVVTCLIVLVDSLQSLENLICTVSESLLVVVLRFPFFSFNLVEERSHVVRNLFKVVINIIDAFNTFLIRYLELV
jgi:hypothetical protein